MDCFYCGECRKTFKESFSKPFCLPKCIHCEEEYKHPCGHGNYCVTCGVKEDVFIDKSNIKGYFFIYCDNKCYVKSMAKMIELSKKKKKKKKAKSDSDESDNKTFDDSD